jgi:hypothetical protein
VCGRDIAKFPVRFSRQSRPARLVNFKRPVQKGCSVRLKMFQQTRAQPNFKNAS